MASTNASLSHKKTSPGFSSNTLKVPNMGGPTSNLRNLAGHLLMSGSSSLTQGAAMHGTSLNDMLLKKNSTL